MSISTRTRPAVTAVLALAIGTAIAGGSAPAEAQPAHPRVVSERPVEWTPHVQDGTVHAITVVGNTVVAGGTFTEVTDATGEFRFTRRHLVAFGVHDGRLSRFEADLDGPVYALAPGPDGTVYVGGAFRTVNGERQRGVTQLRLDTGARVPEFRAAINWGEVRAMARHQGSLYLGGTFTAVGGATRAGLARLQLPTGTADPGFDAALGLDTGDRVMVEDLAVTPDGGRLAAVGAFSHARGLLRPQLVMMETGGREARLARWYTDGYERRCAPFFQTYLRGVDFAPDGSYLVAVTTGGMTRPDRLCNTAARFEATGTGMHRPTWVNHTGGDTLLSVAVTGAAVYVGGHQRWHDNPRGNKSRGPGAVEREGIAALHPRTGEALPWNPGRARGVGVEAFHATSSGLFVGSDTTRLGGAYHARIGMFLLPG